MDFTDNIITQAYHRQKKRCAICGIKGDEFLGTYQAHHIIPKSAGGSDELDNCALLCSTCHVYDAHRGSPNQQTYILDEKEYPYLNLRKKW